MMELAENRETFYWRCPMPRAFRPLAELADLASPHARGLWLVEVLLDTGQRYQSQDLQGRDAAALALDLAGRLSTVLVTAIKLGTGEAVEELGANVWASERTRTPVGSRWTRRRDLIAERCG